MNAGRPRPRAGLLLALLIVLSGSLVSPTARSQTLTAGISVTTNAPQFGRIVRGTSATSFTVDAAAGTISRSGTGAVRLDTAGGTPPTVTLTCVGTPAQCTNSGRRFTVTINASAPTGSTVSIAGINVGSLTNLTLSSGSTSSTTGSLVFIVGPFSSCSGSGQNQTCTGTFKLGLSINVGTSGTTGAVAMPVSVSFARTA